jgi:hypothetical protein
MESPMRSHRWEARRPDWAAAAVAGFGAGGVLMLLELFWSTLIVGSNPWGASRMVAAIVMGIDVLNSSDYSTSVLVVALVTHYVIGVALGMLLGAIIAPFHLDSSAGMVLLAGAIFGLLIYLVNFYIVVAAFPWFAAMRGWSTAVAHLIFGMTAAITYWKLERTEA